MLAEEHSEATWQLIRRTAADGSVLKSWQEQQSCIGKDDEVPSAQVMTYAIVGYYLAASEWLLGQCYVRTSSVSLDGHHIFVGFNPALKRFIVSYTRDNNELSYLGVSVRKRILGV